MEQAAIYTRISKDHAGLGQGVERQQDDCVATAERRGWTIQKVYEDNDLSASGKVKRPEFEALLRTIAAGNVKTVVAWNLDRLTRNRTDTVRLIELCQQHSITIALARGSDLDMSTPSGRMFADMLANWARFEIEQKGERQKRANLQRASKGLPHVTHRPFGYEADCLTIRPNEAETLHLLAKLVLAGNSYQETAWQLNERGLTTSRGDKFIGLQVRKFLMTKRYAAIREYQGVDYPAQWPAIFDTDTWQQLQIVIKLRSDLGAGNNHNSKKFLLTGLLCCGECGHMLTGMTDKHHRTKQTQRAYRCFRIGRTERKGGCGKIYRNAEHLETYIREQVLYRLDTPALSKLMTSNNRDGGAVKGLLAERNRQQQRIAGMVDDYATGLLTRTQLAQAKATAEAELERIENEIGKLTARSAVIDLPLDKTLSEAWDSHRDEWRRRLLDLLIERVVLLPGNTNTTVRRPDGSYYRFSEKLVEIAWRV